MPPATNASVGVQTRAARKGRKSTRVVTEVLQAKKDEDYYRWVAKSVQPMVVPAWVYGEDGKQDVAKFLRWSAGGSE